MCPQKRKVSRRKKRENIHKEKQKTQIELPGMKDIEVKVIDKRFWAKEGDEAASESSVKEPDLKPTYVKELEDKMRLMEKRFREKTRHFHDETKRIHERLAREMDRRLKEETHNIVLDFVEVLDSLELAIQTAQEHDVNSDFLHGVKLVRDMFSKKLEKRGLEKIGDEGEDFNPRYHEAIEVRNVTDGKLDNRIVSVWQKGYRVGDNLIRPARVSVGKFVSKKKKKH